MSEFLSLEQHLATESGHLGKQSDPKNAVIWSCLETSSPKAQLVEVNTRIVNECLETYRKDMIKFIKEKVLQGNCDYKDVIAMEELCREKAMEQYDDSEVLGDGACVEEYREKLVVMIKECYNKERENSMGKMPPINEIGCTIL